ncbi:double-strand break repair helicase AddA [Ahrensia sp. R2A130]|uniref:double-strand break repair helicase AddA n=1 Tax=Ahrensia sp. R2A130 TaxID=744979 RepID=UPI0001E0E88C|nr:double-strand break repair helicase AddA [Ahrensia sp. R2A130]EFL89868.1 double-strand break repair helicase AddA [Ahrensia sp. R2A130]
MKRAGLIIPPQTSLEQAKASAPDHSAWVSANAGSGKTYVLTQRVVRLLLAGTDPSRILCLTFTKAAAGVMSNRVFETLASFASLDDDALKTALVELEGPNCKAPSREKIQRARTLFARALETPGGLKIQTIHAFCESLLHQFPLEANVPGNFSALDEAQGKQMLEQARRDVIVDADAAPESDLGKAFHAILDAATDHAIEQGLSEAISKREVLTKWLAESGGPEGVTEIALSAHGFAVDETVTSLRNGAVAASLFAMEEWTALSAEARDTGAANAIKLADRIDLFLHTVEDERYDAYLAVLQTGGKPRKFSSFVPKAMQGLLPDFANRFDAEQDRLIAAAAQEATLSAIHRTAPFLTFIQAIAARYERSKRQVGALDFDDLIARAADLLTRADARAWVLYKLDLGIDHVLVDEAQDTSPRQWQVISALVEEFFAGQGARNTNRTVFAVGDEKQSIYSFQGARPESFDTHRRLFERASKNAGGTFENANLNLSFRSTADVLDAVDAVFKVPQNMPGVTQGEGTIHDAARSKGAGQVDVWPLISAEKAEESEDWTSQQEATIAASEKLALQVAGTIKSWIGNEPLGPNGRAMQAGDILVLVRSRDAFVTALNRELKSLEVEVAGSDRLTITDHIAVEDLMALAQVMLTPQDDLALAGLLKSPLIGLDEDDLYKLARSRMEGAVMRDRSVREHNVSLFQGLRDQLDEPKFAAAWNTIKGWRRRADILPVYEFFALILGADGGRRKFMARLGPEVEDVLDAFASATMDHESRGLPGLQNFLERLSTEQPEIKRELDQRGEQVRIMTVHAAKGMEAPVVFVVDKSSKALPGQFYPALYRWGDQESADNRNGGWLWVPKTNQHGTATTPAFEREHTGAENEYRRLLYVAMTRAEDRLILCGTCGVSGPDKVPEPSWYNMLERGLEGTWRDVEAQGAVPQHHRWYSHDRAEREGDNPAQTDKQVVDVTPLPATMLQPMERAKDLPKPLSPSGATALIDEGRTEPRAVPSLLEPDAPSAAAYSSPSPRKLGTAVHRIFELWPVVAQNDRMPMGERILDQQLGNLDPAMSANIIYGVQQVVEDPRVADLFDPATSRAEVAVMGVLDIGGTQRSVTGTIDRMAVTEDAVYLLDFKTGEHVPADAAAAPASYVTQLALYRAIVQRLYPDKSVYATLIWTAAQDVERRIMTLPSAMLDEAMAELSQR